MKHMPDYRPENRFDNHKENLVSKGVEDSFGLSLAFNLDHHTTIYKTLPPSHEISKILNRLYRNAYNDKPTVANAMLREFCLAASEILNEGTK